MNVSTNNCTKMKFSIEDFFSRCDQICSFQRIWSHLLKKFLMENFIFCAVNKVYPEGVSVENNDKIMKSNNNGYKQQ